MNNEKSAFWRGFVTGVPFIIIVAPFSMVFGVAATEAGLDIAQVMAFSMLVVAGASQFTALQLMQENASLLIALFAALVVNLRMAMYAASLAPHLGTAPLWKRALIGYLNFDNSFVVSLEEYESHPNRTTAEKVAFFFGVALPTATFWWGFTYVGAVVGTSIPDGYAIDFAIPIAFLGMIAPGLKSLAHVAAAFTSVTLALLLFWVPSGLGLIIAALAATMVGAEIERRQL